ncbi:MAG: NUDIX hydrolase [Candidatus Buchananbacteria bacterium]
MAERLLNQEPEQEVPETISPKVRRFFEYYGGGNNHSIDVTSEEKDKYDLRVIGPFNESDIIIDSEKRKWDSKAEQRAGDFITEYVADFVRKRNIELTQKGERLIENNSKLQVKDIKLNGPKCDMVVEKGVITYGSLRALGTDEEMEKAYRVYESNAPKDHINKERFYELFKPLPLSACILVITADNELLLTKRLPKKVGAFGGVWHVPGGFVEESDINDDGHISPFTAAVRELEEETGVTKKDLAQILCLGASSLPGPRNIEFLFVALSRLKSDDIVDEQAATLEEKYKLMPKEIEGDLRPHKLIELDSGRMSKVLPALLKIDEIFGSQRKHMPVGPKLSLAASQSLFFLTQRMFESLPEQD